MRAPGNRDGALTGAGCVTALAFGLEATYAAIHAGASGLRTMDDVPPASGMEMAAIVEAPYLRTAVPRALEPQIKFLNGAGELAVEVCAEALGQAGLADAGYPPEMRGLYLAQMDDFDWACPEFHDAVRTATEGFTQPVADEPLNRASTRRVKPFFLLESLKNNAFSFLATMFDLRGANTSLSGFAGPTFLAVDLGLRALARGSVDAAVVVGAARAASGVARAEMHANGIRPPPGEGAGALVFERVEDAEARGAAVQAVVLGTGAATHRPDQGSWAPPASALAAAAARALETAGAEPGELAAVIAPGLGEHGLLDALGEIPAAAGVPLRAFKAETGHCALASDAIEIALVAEVLRVERGGPVLVLSAGLLGQTGALVLSRP